MKKRIKMYFVMWHGWWNWKYLSEIILEKARKHYDVSASAFTTLDAKQEWRVLQNIHRGSERSDDVIAENHLLEVCMENVHRKYFSRIVRSPYSLMKDAP